MDVGANYRYRSMKGTGGIKATKTRPMSANMVKLFAGDGFVVYWKGRAKPRRRGAKKASRPTAKPWASIVVFLTDPARRKRSYHISWNGQRLNETLDAAMLWEREPAIARSVQPRLSDYNEKIIKGWRDDGSGYSTRSYAA